MKVVKGSRGPLVEARDVWKRYEGVVALRDVSLRAAPGEVTVIAGPSGSGKSTLLRILAGLEDPDSGDILFDGASVVRDPPWARNTVMLSQRPILLPHLTVRENLVLAAEARGAPRGEAGKLAEEVARRLGITGLLDRKPGTLSGGQLQRASLATVLAAKPRVLLLDEPFAHLDLPLRESFRRLVRGLAYSESITVIQVTHDQDEALEVADSLAILVNGRVLEERDPQSIYYDPGSIETAVFLGHNVACSPPLSPRRGVPVTFPPEAVSLGEGPLGGVVTYVAARKHHTLVYIDLEGVEVKAVLAGVRGVKVGARVRFDVDHGMVKEWPGASECGVSLYE